MAFGEGGKANNYLIDADSVKFSYYAESELSEAEESKPDEGEERLDAVNGVSLKVEKGEFIVILGPNGSGKSTIAKLFNALLLPREGLVYINGMSTLDEDHVWEIRRAMGMVFQNPDNQIVGTTVEEDVAFGVENLGVEPAQIRSRIETTMKATGVYELADDPPYRLSGGQKQRVAIAGILAMKPECIILDEATAMLDPDGRREVLSIVRELNKNENISVILITHHMDEAGMADRVIVVDEGKIVLEGTPKELFSDVKLVKSMGLDVPEITELFDILEKRGIDLPRGVIDIDEAYCIIREKLETLESCQ